MTHTRLSRMVISASMPLQRARLRRRIGRLVLEHVQGIPVVVLPEVFNPAVFRSTDVLMRSLRGWSDAVAGRRRVLDMGTGTGVLAIAAARFGHTVVAVDVNPEAVRCAKMNSLLNHVEGDVEVREGDLFEPVGPEQFDLVVFNPPFFTGQPRSRLDQAWRSVDALERFAAGLPAVLAPGGRALVALSSHGGEPRITTSLCHAGLCVTRESTADFGNEIFTVLDARRLADGA
jgi:release factor glutamine methyltransferase